MSTSKPLCRDLAPGAAIQWGTSAPQTIRERKADDSGWWMTDGSGIVDWAFDKDDEWQLAGVSANV